MRTYHLSIGERFKYGLISPDDSEVPVQDHDHIADGIESALPLIGRQGQQKELQRLLIGR